MSTRNAPAAAEDAIRTRSPHDTAAGDSTKIATLREWLITVAEPSGMTLIVSPEVPRGLLDAPLMGCVAGRAGAQALEALAFAGGFSLVFDGDIIHVQPQSADRGVWQLVCGPRTGVDSARGERAATVPAGKLADATLPYAMARCAGEIGAAVFALPAIYDGQPLIRLTGDERGAVQLVSALAASCEAIAVGFGGDAFVLSPALPGMDGFDQLDANVWARNAYPSNAAGAASRLVSLDVPGGTVASQAATLAAAVGATATLGSPEPGPARRIGRFQAEGRFSDVADIWCGSRRLEWSLVSGPSGVEFVVRSATGAPTLSPPRN